MKRKRLTIGAVLFWCFMAVAGAAWCGDNGNGTVTVNGLIWLKDAGCLKPMSWYDAMARAKTLAHGQCSLTDNSKAGDWRIATVDELKAVYSVKSQFTNVKDYIYWSSSTYAGNSSVAWVVSMPYCYLYYYKKDLTFYAWPVRGGQ